MKVYEPPISDDKTISDDKNVTAREKIKSINDYFLTHRASALAYIVVGGINTDYERFYGNPVSKESFDNELDRLYSIVSSKNNTEDSK